MCMAFLCKLKLKNCKMLYVWVSRQLQDLESEAGGLQSCPAARFCDITIIATISTKSVGMRICLHPWNNPSDQIDATATEDCVHSTGNLTENH